jgi:N-acetylneuraminic acid mutarotase
MLQAQWVQVADFAGGERDDLVAFTCNNRAFAGSGMVVGYQVTNDFYEYKSNTNQWTAISALPGVARQYAFSFSFEAFACVFAGINQASEDLKDGFLFNPTNNLWSSVMPYPGLGSGGCAATTIGNLGFAGLGKNSSGQMQNDWWSYNLDQNTWIQKSNFPGVARNLATCFESNGNIYIIGGNAENNMSLTDVWEYNPATDTWDLLNISIPAPTANAASCKIKMIGVMVGGYDLQNSYHNTCQFFNGFNEQFNSFGAILVDGFRKGARAFALNDELYVLCGITESNVRLKSVFKYAQIDGLDKDNGFDHLIQINPNPASNFAEIKFDEKTIENTQIYLTNLSGEILLKRNIPLYAKGYHLDLTTLSAGFYYVTIFNSKGNKTYKLSIIK